MITKQANIFKDTWNRVPKGVRSNLGKAEAMGIGPFGTAIAAYEIGTGRASVGGTVGATAAGTVAGFGTQHMLKKPLASMTKTLATKVPKAGPLRHLKMLPGPLGKAIGFGAMMYTGMKGAQAGRNIGKKYMPIWQKKQEVPLPAGLSGEHLEKYKQLTKNLARGDIRPQALNENLDALGRGPMF